MNKPPIIHSLSRDELKDLALAKSLLEHPGFTIRMAGLIGAPLESGFALLPAKWNQVVNQATHAALLKALRIAVGSLGKKNPRAARELFHKVLAGTSGSVGGAFGLAALPVELPVSTTIMLRSIADIARSEGHDISLVSTKLECLEVFALGGKPVKDDPAQSAYWLTRAALAKSVSEAASYLAQKGAVEATAPAIVRLINVIAARFGVLVSEEVAAKAVPLISAASGGLINVLFMDHFQDMARGHFIVKRLEARHGSESVKGLYEEIEPR